MDYNICVMAGPGGENSDVYKYVDSTIPKIIDDPFYNSLSSFALKAAAEIVRATNKKIRLELSVEER